MKKAAIFLLSVIFCLTLFGCQPDAYEGEKSITVIIDMTAYDGDITVDEGVQEYQDMLKEIDITTEALRLEHVLSELAKDKFITYSGRGGAYGLELTNIDGIEADLITYSPYYFIFTNDETYSDKQYGTYQYNGQEIGSANFGITDLPVKDGCVYAIVYTY